jgi:hypothetical protein
LSASSSPSGTRLTTRPGNAPFAKKKDLVIYFRGDDKHDNVLENKDVKETFTRTLCV